MKFTSQKEKLIEEINEFSGGRLKNTGDLLVFMEAASVSDRSEDIFREMLFIAKYINGLGKILESNLSLSINRERLNIDPDQTRQNIMNEYKRNFLLFSELLRELLNYTDDALKTVMEGLYLSLKKDSVANINSLIQDLSWVKKYYNSRK